MRLMQNHYYNKSAIDIMKGEKVDGMKLTEKLIGDKI